MNRTALYAGSFDPLTNGHLNVIERAASLFDELVIGIVVNPNKKSVLSLEERTDIVSKVTSHLDNVRITSFGGLLADYVNNNDIDVVVRGLRNTVDFEYEKLMADTNADMYEHAETVFLMSEPSLAYVSSSMVKEIASLGGDVSKYVPDIVNDALNKVYGRND